MSFKITEWSGVLFRLFIVVSGVVSSAAAYSDVESDGIFTANQV
jgi:hypothetical protein